MTIRRAENRDINAVLNLLSQILEIHAIMRPDLFKSGTRKYTAEELEQIFKDKTRPVFVADDMGKVVGYCFCQIQEITHSNNLRESRSLFIDDLCVDENCRHKQVGSLLYDYVASYARSIGCYDIILYLWEGNDTARKFYDSKGFTPRKTMMEKLL